MDGELDEASAQAMISHIAECDACAREFAAYEKIIKGLQTVDEPLPVGFEQRWKKAVWEGPASRRKTSFGKLMPALATGVAAVAVIGAILATGVLNKPAPDIVSMRAVQENTGSTILEAGQESQASIAGSAETGNVMMAPAATQPPAEPAAPVASAAAQAASVAASESPQMKLQAQDSTAAPPVAVQVPSDTLDVLQTTFMATSSVRIEFTRSGNHLTVAITEENIDAIASIAKGAGLEIIPQIGETYDFYSVE